MVTLRTIAEKCGVDISTVSKVIHGREIRVTDETRAKILSTAEALDYRPNALARSLRLRRSGAIVLALRTTSNLVYPEIIDGAQEAAEESGICLFLYKYTTGVKAASSLISLVKDGRVDGILWDDLPYPEFSKQLIDADVPFVCLNGYSDVEDRSVTLDDRLGFIKQANYLADLGHREIGYIGVEPQSAVSVLCRETFLEALRNRGIEVPKERVWHCGFSGDNLDCITEKLTLPGRPSAVATASVIVAKRLANDLIRANIRVPQDLSIIGYHDGPEAEWNYPGITTVKMPSRRQGNVALKKLLEQISGKTSGREFISDEPIIVERESCAPFTR